MTDYGITFFFMTVVLRPTQAYEQRDQLVSGHASLEWVMGRYFTPDTVLRDRRQKWVMK